jgi:hypothetical protein
MIKAIRLSTAGRLEEKDSPALLNPAVAHCVEVWKTTRQQSLANGESDYGAGSDAALAYRAAMPPLTGHQNIVDFIACVAYCMALEMIPEEKATSLLYAARTAFSIAPKEPQEAKKQPAAA